MSQKDDIQQLSEYGWGGIGDDVKARLKSSFDKAHLQAISDSGWGAVSDDTKSAVRNRWVAQKSDEPNEYGVPQAAYDAAMSSSSGSRDRAAALAEEQYATGQTIPSTQAVLPSLYQSSSNGEDLGSRAKSFIGDIVGLPGRAAGAALLGIGSGVAGAAGHARENVAQKIDPMVGMLPAVFGPASRRFQKEMASPVGVTGSPSSALLFAPYLEIPGLLAKVAEAANVTPKVARALMSASEKAAEFKAAHPMMNAIGTGAAYGAGLDVAGNAANTLGGAIQKPIAVPDALMTAGLAVPGMRRSILQSVSAGNGAQQGESRSLGGALFSPIASATVAGIGSGLAEMGLHAIPGIGNMIDQEIKYALKGKRGAGVEMSNRLGEIVDEAIGRTGSGAFGGLGSIERVAENARSKASRGYDAVGNAIAPKSSGAARGGIVTDVNSPLYGHPLPKQEMFGEYLGWVPPPGKEPDLEKALTLIREGGETHQASIPFGSWLDVGKGSPASLNDLYQEARQNMFQKMASGDPAYASVTRSQAERALEEKFRSAHGLQMEPKLYRGAIPNGEQLPTMYWPDLSALRVPANVRQGSSLRANGAAFQNAIRNELGDVVTKYMYGNNAAVEMAGMRQVLNDAAKNYKKAKTGEQLAIQDATKRVGTENPLISALRPAPERLRYALPMLARYMGKQMQTEAAPIIAGTSGGDEGRSLVFGNR